MLAPFLCGSGASENSMAPKPLATRGHSCLLPLLAVPTPSLFVLFVGSYAQLLCLTRLCSQPCYICAHARPPYPSIYGCVLSLVPSACTRSSRCALWDKTCSRVLFFPFGWILPSSQPTNEPFPTNLDLSAFSSPVAPD